MVLRAEIAIAGRKNAPDIHLFYEPKETLEPWPACMESIRQTT